MFCKISKTDNPKITLNKNKITILKIVGVCQEVVKVQEEKVLWLTS